MLRRLRSLCVAVWCACAPTTPGSGGSASAPCSAANVCSSGQTCLPTGACAASCTSDAQCSASGGKCSAAGGCIAASGCGGSLDCAAGTVCGNGVCVAACTPSSCATGEHCTSSGRCLADTSGSGGGTVGHRDAGISVFIEGVSCGGERYTATAVQANFLIVLDHSGSMKELVGGAPKWETAVTAIRSVTAQHEATIRFGLQMFSAASSVCFAGKVDVPVAEGQAGAISATMPAVADGKNTPIGGALKAAASNEGIRDSARSNNILLITDGEENCNGNPVNEVKSLFTKNVKTYVVGFGGQVDADMLSQMATQGGTARPAATKYYQADDPAALATAFSAIANGAQACDLKLVVPPPDTARIYVYVNGVLQSRDPSRKNGWDYLASGNRVALYGGTCSVLTTQPNADVTIVYGCPDGTLVPGGPGSICLANDDCGSGNCAGGLCVAPTRADGSPCTTNGDCASGQCNSGLCETPSGGGRPVGASCGGNADCASMVCLGGFCTSPIN